VSAVDAVEVEVTDPRDPKHWACVRDGAQHAEQQALEAAGTCGAQLAGRRRLAARRGKRPLAGQQAVQQ